MTKSTEHSKSVDIYKHVVVRAVCKDPPCYVQKHKFEAKQECHK